MNLRKKIFIFGGSSLIIVILAIRLGAIDTIKKKLKKQNTNNVNNSSIKQVVPKNKNKKNVEKKPVQQQPKAVQISKKNETKKVEVIAKSTNKQSAKPIVVNNKITKEKNKVEHKHHEEEINIGQGNPFEYASASTNHFSPLSSNNQVGLISIKGIIFIKGKKPKAILHIANLDKTYYVSTGDVIRLNSKAKTGSVVTETYISVKEIRQDEVELVQQERPDQVIIIR